VHVAEARRCPQIEVRFDLAELAGYGYHNGPVFSAFHADHGRAGLHNAPSLLDYRIPTVLDLPMIDTVLVEVPNDTHPYGVRGVGETPIIGPLPAVGNAVSRATGIRMTELPLSPPRVLAAIDAR